ncbi:hypothetical protein BGZ76_000896 [Entomortierella beljakovae]|nr:hypothetical protein BGZ76_000896 [Entomortierella beljakovae]
MKAAPTLITFLASSLPFLTSIANAFVYPATPVGNTVWKPNSTVNITWSDDKSAPLLSSKPVFDIFLMTGADDRQIKLQTIATNVKGGSTNSVTYKVPHVSPPGQIYFLMFQTPDQSATAWATRFTITDANGYQGTLRPVIPDGGRINPGGIGSIISQIEGKEEAKANKKTKSKSKPMPQVEQVESNSGNEPSKLPLSTPNTNTEDRISNGASLGAGSKTTVTNGGNSDPSLVDVGTRVNKEKKAGAQNAANSNAIAASSSAMVVFVGFAVLMGF